MLSRLRSWFRRTPPTFDPAWEPVLEAQFDHWNLLDDAELERMRMLVARFFHGRRWEAAQGMDLTEDAKVLISAQASMLLLGLDLDEYLDVSSVIVHKSTMRVKKNRPTGGGVWSAGTQHISGQAHHKGPVMLSWSAARQGARVPERGMNVVYHEFAHRLDMMDGVTDGTPPLGDEAAQARWQAVCTEAFARVHDGESILRNYAGTNPAEFFAVATELFFNRPFDVYTHERDLYDELRSFYGQDPASRLVRAGIHPDA